MPIPRRPDNRLLSESPVAAQLERGFRGLRFTPGLEQEFRDDYLTINRAQLRVNLALAMVLMGAFAILDRMLLEASTQRLPDILRFGVVVPLILVLIAATYSTAYLRLYPVLVKVAMPAAAISVVIIEAIAARAGVELVFSTLVITTIYAYFLVGMRFYAAFCSNLALLAGYLALGLWMDPPLPAHQLVYSFSVLLLAHMIGAAACYHLETANRIRYLEARLLQELAARDGLPVLYNRRLFDERVSQLWQQAQREQQPLAMLLVDIDHFKRFNDHYGHQAGDETLKAVAAALAAHARRPLDFAARYGGEEFALVLYGSECDTATAVAGQLREDVEALAIAHAMAPAGVLTVSVGVACVQPQPERSSEGLIQLADEALYEAKNGGRNRVAVKSIEYGDLVTGNFRTARKG